jgi:xylulokinase
VRGAALLASVALGYIDYEDIPSRVPIAEIYQPNPEHRRIYDELFREFVAIYESNRKIYERLNRIKQ